MLPQSFSVDTEEPILRVALAAVNFPRQLEDERDQWSGGGYQQEPHSRYVHIDNLVLEEGDLPDAHIDYIND